jgi:hypothetical protein
MSASANPYETIYSVAARIPSSRVATYGQSRPTESLRLFPQPVDFSAALSPSLVPPSDPGSA